MAAFKNLNLLFALYQLKVSQIETLREMNNEPKPTEEQEAFDNVIFEAAKEVVMMTDFISDFDKKAGDFLNDLSRMDSQDG